jgi:ABC-2 type transport system ATP-binding protein
VLVSSHLMSELQDIAGHVVVVGHGRVIAAADVDDLLGEYTSLEAAYLKLTAGVGGIR